MLRRVFGSVLGSSLAYNFINQFVNIGFPVFLSIYLVRVLALEDLGKWYLVTASISLVQFLVASPHFWLVKRISENTQKTGVTLMAALVVYAGIATVIFPFYYTYFAIYVPDIKTIALVAYVQIFTSVFAFEYYFQAKLLNKFIMYRRLCVRLVYISIVVFLIRKPTDFGVFIYIAIATLIVEHCINFAYILRTNLLENSTIDEITRVAKSIRSYLPFNATYNTLPQISLIIIERFSPYETVALYSIFFRVINMATTFITSSFVVFFPYFIAHGSSQTLRRKILAYKLLLAVGAALVFILFRDLIFWIFVNAEITPEMTREFCILTAFVVLHTGYNYMVFADYLPRDNVNSVVFVNLSILATFVGLITLLPSVGTSLSISVVISMSFGLILLTVFKRTQPQEE